MERNTRQRTAIREAIAQSGRPLLPPEVLEAAQALAPGLSLATVYRNLNALVEEGALLPVSLPGESVRFELAEQAHHHHFKCERCQRVFDVHACPGDLSHMLPSGFQVRRHDLTLYGQCGDCAVVRASVLPVKALGSRKVAGNATTPSPIKAAPKAIPKAALKPALKATRRPASA
jgi:Fur family transcriptional regulator, ferric uptake regulator